MAITIRCMQVSKHQQYKKIINICINFSFELMGSCCKFETYCACNTLTVDAWRFKLAKLDSIVPEVRDMRYSDNRLHVSPSLQDDVGVI